MLKYLHDIVENTPSGCTCTVDEQVNLAGGAVMGYTLVAECPNCQDIREAATVARVAAQKTARIAEIKNLIVRLDIEKDKATTLGYSELATLKANEITALQTELTALEA